MPKRPNIILILADQLRHDMLASYGHPAVITPNLDRLAAAGTLFTNCYATNPVCTPSRASMITGKYCSEHHCHANGQILSPHEVCFPALLRDSGYYTAIVGKLHLWEQFIKPSPVDTGFQYRQMIEGKYSFAPRVEESGLYFDYLRDRGLELPCRFLQDQGEHGWQRRLMARFSEYGEDDHIDGFLTTRAIRQIEDDHRGPLFMQLGLCSPHEFYDPPPEYFDMYADREIPAPVYSPAANAMKSPALQAFQRRGAERFGLPPEEWDEETRARIRFMRRCYLATVTLVDRQVGRIIAALKRQGIYENTAVIFSADHGEFQGDHGCILKDLFLYEVNVHTPLIIHAPFLKTEPGVVESCVQNLDIFATVLDLAGLPVPEGVSSQSLLPALRDSSRAGRDAAFSEAGDRKMIRMGRYKLIHEADPQGLELYDLAADPHEQVNLARASSDPARSTRDPAVLEIIARMLRRLVVWQTEVEGGSLLPATPATSRPRHP